MKNIILSGVILLALLLSGCSVLSSFKESNLQMEMDKAYPGETVFFSVDVKNEGLLDGEYIPHLFIDGVEQNTYVTIEGELNLGPSADKIPIKRNEAITIDMTCIFPTSGNYTVQVGTISCPVSVIGLKDDWLVGAGYSRVYSKNEKEYVFNLESDYFVISHITFHGGDSGRVKGFYILDSNGQKRNLMMGDSSDVGVYPNMEVRGNFSIHIPFEDTEKTSCGQPLPPVSMFSYMGEMEDNLNSPHYGQYPVYTEHYDSNHNFDGTYSVQWKDPVCGKYIDRVPDFSGKEYIDVYGKAPAN
jgi:hypothetical protein